MTEEEAANYTNVSQMLCEQISEHFSTFGCTDLSRVEKMAQAVKQESVELFFNGKSWGYYETPEHISFMIGVLHDFKPHALADIMQTFDICPIKFIDQIDFIREKIPSLGDRHVDGRIFGAKIVEAFHIANPLEAKDLFSRHFDHSGVTIAFIAGGDAGGVADQLINDEYARAKRGIFRQNASHPVAPLQAEISEFPGLVELLEHLPNNSPIEFFDKVGAWNPNVLKKTLYQNACWENIIAYRTNNYVGDTNKSMMRQLATPLYAAHHKDKLDLMLSNIAMDTTEYDHDYHAMVEDMLEWVSDSPFSHYADKVTFALSLTRNYIRFADEPISLKSLFDYDPNTGPRCLALQDALVKKGCRLYQAIIDETLSLPDDYLGYHHLTLPLITKNLNLSAQVTKKGSFEKYLTKMARVCLDYQLEINPPEPKQNIDAMIDEGLRHWVTRLSQTSKFDPKCLDFSNEKMAEQFIRWGMDIKLAPSPTERSMTMALERDLGI